MRRQKTKQLLLKDFVADYQRLVIKHADPEKLKQAASDYIANVYPHIADKCRAYLESKSAN